MVGGLADSGFLGYLIQPKTWADFRRLVISGAVVDHPADPECSGKLDHPEAWAGLVRLVFSGIQMRCLSLILMGSSGPRIEIDATVNGNMILMGVSGPDGLAAMYFLVVIYRLVETCHCSQTADSVATCYSPVRVELVGLIDSETRVDSQDLVYSGSQHAFQGLNDSEV